RDGRFTQPPASGPAVGWPARPGTGVRANALMGQRIRLSATRSIGPTGVGKVPAAWEQRARGWQVYPMSRLDRPGDRDMKKKRIERVLLLGLAVAVCTAAPAGVTLDTAKIEDWTGAKGTVGRKEGVFKVSVPRSDLSVSVAGAHLTPPMGLASWAAFKRGGHGTMVMGDMVLAEDQVNPVLSVALDNGLEVTALHNH